MKMPCFETQTGIYQTGSFTSFSNQKLVGCRGLRSPTSCAAFSETPPRSVCFFLVNEKRQPQARTRTFLMQNGCETQVCCYYP